MASSSGVGPVGSESASSQNIAGGVVSTFHPTTAVVWLLQPSAATMVTAYGLLASLSPLAKSAPVSGSLGHGMLCEAMTPP